MNTNFSESQVIETVSRMEEKKLLPSSHLYKRFGNKSIGDSAEIFSKEYCNEAKRKPGLVLLSVILAAHRNYTKQVEPQIDRIRLLQFSTFNDLKKVTKSFNDFSSFCGMRDLEKYNIILKLIEVIERMKSISKVNDDFEVMKIWAEKANYLHYKEDIIGQIKGIGLATFQHLRMNFGANTVKPDQRVKEVLNREFGFCHNNDIAYIFAVENISKILNKNILYIDQVFVNYGSGYYYTEKEINKIEALNEKQQNILVNKKINNLSVKNNVELMIEFIKDSIKDLDIVYEKRNDGGFIGVAKEFFYRKTGKNVFTYWPTGNSLSVIVLQLLPRKTFYNIDQLKSDNVVGKIRNKYYQMIG